MVGGGEIVTLHHLTNTIYDMKKILLLLVAVATLSFVGCSDDDEKTSNPLSGTTWERTEDGILGSLSFSDTQCKFTLKIASSSSNYATTIYDYTYNDPKVTLYPLDDELAILEGEISGSAMTVTNTSSGENIGIYIKQ